jgi:hypothetical protein
MSYIEYLKKIADIFNRKEKEKQNKKPDPPKYPKAKEPEPPLFI